MTSMLLQLSLCIAAVIQLALSDRTCDQLLTSVPQLEKHVSGLTTDARQKDQRGMIIYCKFGSVGATQSNWGQHGIGSL